MELVFNQVKFYLQVLVIFDALVLANHVVLESLGAEFFQLFYFVFVFDYQMSNKSLIDGAY